LEEEDMVLLNDVVRKADLSVADNGDLPGLGLAQRTAQPTTILRPRGMAVFMDNRNVEVPPARFRLFTGSPALA
jgi:hypothetical protein